tara:strand:- start:14303 stop:16225 length:1923 start_codon:yes stop_codon:yes gene_type:complete
MADNDDYLDDLDLELEPSTARFPRKRGHTVENLLPRALIESVIGIEGIRDISTREGFCLVVEAPSFDWCEPLHRALKTMGSWDLHHCPPAIKKPSRDDVTSQQLVAVLGTGGRAFGISHQPAQMLPPAMLASADQVLKLPPPDARVISAVIKAVTGTIPEGLHNKDIAGLEFEEMAACIRQGSNADECLNRLRRAVDSKRRIDTTLADVPEIADLHGYGVAKEWAVNLLEDLESWRRGEIPFEAIDRNAVLVSPPGMGKTTFARSLAKSAGLPLIATSVGAWFANSPGYLDSIIKQIDQTFAMARAMSPAILLLDELDAVPDRATISPRGADWWLPVITHLLITLDGAVSNATNNLIILGATNHGDRIDRALVRPGRLSKIIEIELPDADDLAGIFRQHLGSDLVGEDLTYIAELSYGATGAQVVDWVRSARRTARRAKRVMEMIDLLEVLVPDERRTAAHVERVAVHEAGHAVVCHTLGLGEVKAISIISGQNHGGYTQTDTDPYLSTRSDLERHVIQALAGRAAEEVLLGEPGTGSGGSSASDLARATMHIGLLHLGTGLGEEMIFRADKESVPLILARSERHSTAVEKHLRELYGQSRDLIVTHKRDVRAIADALIEKRFLNGSNFLSILEWNGRKP